MGKGFVTPEDTVWTWNCGRGSPFPIHKEFVNKYYVDLFNRTPQDQWAAIDPELNNSFVEGNANFGIGSNGEVRFYVVPGSPSPWHKNGIDPAIYEKRKKLVEDLGFKVVDQHFDDFMNWDDLSDGLPSDLELDSLTFEDRGRTLASTLPRVIEVGPSHVNADETWSDHAERNTGTGGTRPFIYQEDEGIIYIGPIDAYHVDLEAQMAKDDLFIYGENIIEGRFPAWMSAEELIDYVQGPTSFRYFSPGNDLWRISAQNAVHATWEAEDFDISKMDLAPNQYETFRTEYGRPWVWDPTTRIVHIGPVGWFHNLFWKGLKQHGIRPSLEEAADLEIRAKGQKRMTSIEGRVASDNIYFFWDPVNPQTKEDISRVLREWISTQEGTAPNRADDMGSWTFSKTANQLPIRIWENKDFDLNALYEETVDQLGVFPNDLAYETGRAWVYDLTTNTIHISPDRWLHSLFYIGLEQHGIDLAGFIDDYPTGRIFTQLNPKTFQQYWPVDPELDESIRQTLMNVGFAEESQHSLRAEGISDFRLSSQEIKIIKSKHLDALDGRYRPAVHIENDGVIKVFVGALGDQHADIFEEFNDELKHQSVISGYWVIDVVLEQVGFITGLRDQQANPEVQNALYKEYFDDNPKEEVDWAIESKRQHAKTADSEVRPPQVKYPDDWLENSKEYQGNRWPIAYDSRTNTVWIGRLGDLHKSIPERHPDWPRHSWDPDGAPQNPYTMPLGMLFKEVGSQGPTAIQWFDSLHEDEEIINDALRKELGITEVGLSPDAVWSFQDDE